MRLLLLFIIAIMTIPLFADEVKPSEKLPETTKQVDKEVKGDKEKQPDITIIPGECLNLNIIEKISSIRIVVEINKNIHNYFAGWFSGLPVNKEITIGLSMDEKGNVSKWNGLSPVLTYANPNSPEAYEWFIKDNNGYWVSSDIEKKGTMKFVGKGKLPQQDIIPEELAPDFLSNDGKFWCPWRDIKGESLPNLNIFRMTFLNKNPTACISMRVPYTYSYLQDFLRKLSNVKVPGVNIDNIGFTKDRRKLQVIRIEDPNDDITIENIGNHLTFDGKYIPQFRINNSRNIGNNHRVILIMSGEHASEHASSWVTEGILRTLISDTPESNKLRQNTTWLIIPMLVPDGRVRSEFNNFTNKFYNQQGDMPSNNKTPDEVISYVSYMKTFVNDGQLLTNVLTIHNIECNEGPVVYSPFGIAEEWETTKIFNEVLFSKLREHGYKVGNDIPIEGGQQQLRFYGWCGMKFESLPLALEVNDRYPLQRLTIKDLQDIGNDVAFSIGTYNDSTEGKKRLAKNRLNFTNRMKERITYVKEPSNIIDSVDALLNLGY